MKTQVSVPETVKMAARNIGQPAFHQNHIGGINRNIGSCADRNPHVGACQSRRVINSGRNCRRLNRLTSAMKKGLPLLFLLLRFRTMF